MHASVIPPIAHLEEFCKGRPFHLVLAHLLGNPDYFKFWASESSRSYVMLDNSAHEFQEGQATLKLLENAFNLGASEVVLPDKLFDSEATIDNTVSAIESISTLEFLRESIPFPRFAMVPQGLSIPDLRDCALGMGDAYLRGQDKFPKKFGQPTVGVSKDYERFPGGLIETLEKVIFPMQDRLKAEVHLFGWGRNLWAYRDIVRQYGPRIRSIDSAKPFVYGAEGILIRMDEPAPKYPRRRSDYFEMGLEPLQLAISQMNVNVFDDMVRGV